MRRRVLRSRVTHDRWLVSYADFITLLFAFFVVLYAFSKADQKKQAAQVPGAIDSAFQSLSLFPISIRDAKSSSVTQTSSVDVAVQEEVRSPAQVRDDFEHIRRELEQRLSSQIARHTVQIQLGREGLIIRMREAGFFGSASAIPRPDTLTTLRTIGKSLRQTPYDVRVEGHTDNVPIHTADFDSNWELSAARATGVARLLLEASAMGPERISAAGYAEYHPIASNDTADGRAENRRVDLVVMPRIRLDLPTGTTAADTGSWRKITDDQTPGTM